MTPAELNYARRINEAKLRFKAAVGGESEVRVIACALVNWFVEHAELGQAIEDLTCNVMLPLVLKNSRALNEGDRALHSALRKIRG